MRPNARTIRKVLLRNCAHVIWGRRAFITVRLPLSVIPPIPSLDYAASWGDPSGFEGSWETPGPDETRLITRISSLTSMRAPEGNNNVHFLETEEHGEHKCYIWWEGARYRMSQNYKLIPDSEELLPESVVGAHRDYVRWCSKYLHGTDGPTGNPVMDAFLAASNHAKTHYANINGSFLYLTYSVKPMYPDRPRRFACDLKRAFRIATKHGVDARLLR